MIFGIIASAFLISFLLYFLQSYTGLQKNAELAKVMDSFESTYKDVYLTGNAVDFNYFSQVDYNLHIDASYPPGIVSKLGKRSLKFMVLFSPGKKLFIDDSNLDMKWFNLRYVVAMPSSRVIFSLGENSDAAWDLVRNITKHMPNSAGFKNRVTFGFCSGNTIKENFCGEKEKDLCDQKEFLMKLEEKPAPGFFKCTRTVSGVQERYRFVEISSSCSGTFRGICITTPDSNGIGKIYVKGLKGYLIYKNPLDIVSVIVGYNYKSIYGVAAETVYKYENIEFAKRISVAADMMSKRAVLLSGEIEKELAANKLDSDSGEALCLPLFQQFSLLMEQIKSIVSDKNYYENLGACVSLNKKLSEAEALQSKIISLGCDYET